MKHLVVLLFILSFNMAYSDVTITAANFKFTPSTFNIPLGQKVVFVIGDLSHNIQSTNNPSSAASWGSGIVNAGSVYTFIPTVTGTYTFICNIHPSSMSGNFTVVNTTVTGVEPPNSEPQEKVIIYPNPTSDKLYFKTIDIKSYGLKASVMDLNGKVLLSKTFDPGQCKSGKGINCQCAANLELDIHSFLSGEYLVTVTDGDDLIASKKIIKQ